MVMKLALILLTPVMAVIIWVMSHFFNFTHISSNRHYYLQFEVEAGAVAIEVYGAGIRPSAIPKTGLSRRLKFESVESNITPIFPKTLNQYDYSVTRTVLGSFHLSAKYAAFVKWVKVTTPMWLVTSLAAISLGTRVWRGKL